MKQITKNWAATFNSITDPISIQDKDFRLVRVNKAYADAFNMKPEEIIGRCCYEIVHGTKEPLLNCPCRKMLETGKPATMEIYEPRLGKHLKVSTSPIFNEQGEATGSTHIIKDITERREAEDKLKRSEEKFLKAGCDAYMSKPFNTRELPEVVSEMLTERQKKPA